MRQLTSREHAMEDLLATCRELRTDPSAVLRVIERVEEIDHLPDGLWRRTDFGWVGPPPATAPTPVLLDEHTPDTKRLRQLVLVCAGLGALAILATMLFGAFLLNAAR